jgi:hypothetical protein
MANRKEIDLNEVERLAGLGLSHEQICTSMDISPATFYRRKQESERFESAIKRGKAASQTIVANKLFELSRKGNLGAIIWWEKTRLGYSDSVKNEHSGSIGVFTVDIGGEIAGDSDETE